MTIPPIPRLLLALATLAAPLFAQDLQPVQRPTAQGTVEGLLSADGKVQLFKGIPYAAPPVGDLRWQPPQPPASWEGVRPAHDFAPRAMQKQIWPDMFFFDEGPSEDCLYLNVWVPTDAGDKPLPVMFWIHGGGFIAGGSSEPRQEGSQLAQEGVIVVSLNYRMGVFGFMAHPELAAESPAGAAGNYGLLDMVAALKWVQANIAGFGGDPAKVTIFGESAGSMAVSALMASPEARGLFHRAIGQSGSALGGALPSLTDSAAAGADFATAIGAADLAALRAMPADELLDKAMEHGRFRPNLDGLFFTAQPAVVFARGEQAPVPLLAGWNLDEGGPWTLLGRAEPTLANLHLAAAERFGIFAERFLAAYSASNDAEAARAAADYGGDRFIATSTWKWLEEHGRTTEQPVYRYRFDRLVPLNPDLSRPGQQPSAAHSWDIEYVFNVLDSKNAPWTEVDRALADQMSTYWANFAKHGDPNGDGLPAWPAYTAANDHPVMHLAPELSVTFDDHRARYEFQTDPSVIFVPDWTLAGSAIHQQVPPPEGFTRPSVVLDQPLGVFEGQADIGGPFLPGRASYDDALDSYSITSASSNIWYFRDEFRYLWKQMDGDVTLAADVRFPKGEGYFDRKAVLVIRQDLDDDSKQIMSALHGGGLVHLAYRAEKGANMAEAEHIETDYSRLRLGIQKAGTQFTLWASFDGEPMHQLGEPFELAFDGPFYVGIGFCSHQPLTYDSTVVSDVVLENEAGAWR